MCVYVVLLHASLSLAFTFFSHSSPWSTNPPFPPSRMPLYKEDSTTYELGRDCGWQWLLGRRLLPLCPKKAPPNGPRFLIQLVYILKTTFVNYNATKERVCDTKARRGTVTHTRPSHIDP